MRTFLRIIISSMLFVNGLYFVMALSNADCLTVCPTEMCRRACNHNVNEKANTNISLHCTGRDFMMIVHNVGTYIIEQSSANLVWTVVKLSSGNLSTLTNLLEGTLYRYRMHKLTMHGLSRPEVSRWFSTYDVNYRPKRVKHISVTKIEVNKTNKCQLQAEIIFEPTKDRSCDYNIWNWKGEHDLINFELRKTSNFRFYIGELDFNQNVTISISSINTNHVHASKETFYRFITPSCLQVHNNNLSICPPEKVEGLRVKEVHKQSLLYDLIITWDKPKQMPDNYTIQIYMLPNIQNFFISTLPGNATECFLLNVELGPQYEVMIIAESIGGTSLVSSVFKYRNASTVVGYQSYHEIIIIISIVVVTATLAVICACYYLRKSKQCSVQYTHFEIRNQKQFSIKTDLRSFKEKCLFENDNIALPPDKFELCPDNLQIKKILGSGAYGTVRLGILRNDIGEFMNVAVKTLNDNPTIDDIKSFHQEILMMKSTGKHPNIVSLIGYCTAYDKPYLVVEYCCNRDLQTFLRMIWKNTVNDLLDRRKLLRSKMSRYVNENRNSEIACNVMHHDACTATNCLYDIHHDVIRKIEHQGVIKKSTNVAGNIIDLLSLIDLMQSIRDISVADLLNFARQVATGMEFLSSNRIVHRDLAARNVLVCSDRVVKISDFGLSRDIYQENIYKKQGNSKLPLKWMAIEALTRQIYTTHSDIWSFGILLWEIVTLGCTPYPGIPINDILKLLKSGYRMEKPQNCSPELYNLMHSCWHLRPQNRPTFSELKNNLDKLLTNYSENKYLTLCDILQESENEQSLLIKK